MAGFLIYGANGYTGSLIAHEGTDNDLRFDLDALEGGDQSPEGAEVVTADCVGAVSAHPYAQLRRAHEIGEEDRDSARAGHCVPQDVQLGVKANGHRLSGRWPGQLGGLSRQ